MAKKKKKKMTPENILIHRLQKQVYRCTDEIIKNVKKFDVFEQQRNNEKFLQTISMDNALVNNLVEVISVISFGGDTSKYDMDKLLSADLLQNAQEYLKQNKME